MNRKKIIIITAAVLLILLAGFLLFNTLQGKGQDDPGASIRDNTLRLADEYFKQKEC